MKEVGTLKELGVKPGDVVEFMPSGEHYRVAGNRHLIVIKDDRDTGLYGCWFTCRDFRIISRASDTPKTWSEMTDEEKGTLLLAHHEGKVIEYRYGVMNEWRNCAGSEPVWEPEALYRIRPEPKRETVRWYVAGRSMPGALRCNDDTHRITFDLIDGKPDCSSIKMERIT